MTLLRPSLVARGVGSVDVLDHDVQVRAAVARGSRRTRRRRPRPDPPRRHHRAGPSYRPPADAGLRPLEHLAARSTCSGRRPRPAARTPRRRERDAGERTARPSPRPAGRRGGLVPGFEASACRRACGRRRADRRAGAPAVSNTGAVGARRRRADERRARLVGRVDEIRPEPASRRTSRLPCAIPTTPACGAAAEEHDGALAGDEVRHAVDDLGQVADRAAGLDDGEVRRRGVAALPALDDHQVDRREDRSWPRPSRTSRRRRQRPRRGPRASHRRQIQRQHQRRRAAGTKRSMRQMATGRRPSWRRRGTAYRHDTADSADLLNDARVADQTSRHPSTRRGGRAPAPCRRRRALGASDGRGSAAGAGQRRAGLRLFARELHEAVLAAQAASVASPRQPLGCTRT